MTIVAPLRIMLDTGQQPVQNKSLKNRSCVGPSQVISEPIHNAVGDHRMHRRSVGKSMFLYVIHMVIDSTPLLYPVVAGSHDRRRVTWPQSNAESDQRVED